MSDRVRRFVILIITVTVIITPTKISSSVSNNQGECSNVIQGTWNDKEIDVDFPIVYRNQDALESHWKFLKKWKDTKYLERNIPDILTNVYTSFNEPVFYFGESEQANLTKIEFFDNLNSKGPLYVYYSGALSYWPTLSQDVPQEFVERFCVRLKDCVPPQIWISEEDVETRTHYDAA